MTDSATTATAARTAAAPRAGRPSPVFLADAAFSAAAGALALALPGTIAGLLGPGVPALVIALLGAGLLAWGGLQYAIHRGGARNAALVRLSILGDAAWVLASVLLVLLAPAAFSGPGIAAVLAVAAAVGAIFWLKRRATAA